MLGNETVSIVCGCKDREAFILQTLPTWLELSQVDEVVIVDWSSKQPLAKVLADSLRNPKTVIAVAPNQSQWHLSKCCNLGLSVASGDIILRLDSDVFIDRRFFDINRISRGRFRAGIYITGQFFQPGLWGTVLAYKDDIEKVNGYDERMIGYGWDDEDLYTRMRNAGLVWERMTHEYLKHIPHGTRLRLGTQTESLEESSARNRQLMLSRPWTLQDRRTRWQMTSSGNLVTCYETEASDCR